MTGVQTCALPISLILTPASTSGPLFGLPAPGPTGTATLQRGDFQLPSHRSQSVPRSGLSFENHAHPFPLSGLFFPSITAAALSPQSLRILGQRLPLASALRHPLYPEVATTEPCSVITQSLGGSPIQFPSPASTLYPYLLFLFHS